MSITRWDPFRELEDVSSRLNRIFGHPAAARASQEQGKDAMRVFDWSPTVDVAETNEEFHISTRPVDPVL